ncbi:MAG: tubulin-like doman-containing protein [Planctomycetaceae bacterium]
MADVEPTQVMAKMPNQTQVIDRSADKPVEIAGYSLESRLGVGGYGEVWRAIGPGGLPKAVKILFGKTDGPQADAELKSLQRMRDLRHPFLLSIERIEVVKSQLVVVMELADGCLENRFQEVRSEGLRGIPRDELLGYLRDTADALDFMFEEHGLQHLDIKPENLLVQGKHVKVGDFGLAKDVSVTNMSIVGGFTPLYAPPEIFEGQPSPSSDQYSLAIVYQTMLTGVPPFSGRTAAQLTAQHLRSTPDLSSLQPVDRPVIARALSKNPSARFPNCRQFVDELTKRRNSRSRSEIRSGNRVSASATKPVSTRSLGIPDELAAQAVVPLQPRAPKHPANFRPTLYIGVGGIGGTVLTSLRSHFESDFGNCNAPCFPMLYIDSDRKAVAAARTTPGQPGLAESELLTIPLRTSAEYRADKEFKLDWLSRRWLFNLPRSGEVEGIRPLGRLALLDSESAVRRRLRDSLTHATSDEAIMATLGETELKLDPGLIDIVIVGSAFGGTSSGSILDIAAIARSEVESLGLEMATVVGVLVHGTSSQREVGDIQEANSISCLQELKHYRTPGLESTNPFDHTYFVQLGDSLSSLDFADRAEDVASYIYSTTVSNLRAYTDHWRDLETSKSTGANGLRTFGFSSIDEKLHSTVSSAARSLCYALAQKWTSQPANPPELSEPRLLLQHLSLSETRLSSRIMAILRGDEGKQIDAWARGKWKELVGRETNPVCAEVVQKLDSAFENDEGVSGILSRLPKCAGDAKQQLTEHLVNALDQPGRLNVASAAAMELVAQLEASVNACKRLLTEIDRSFNDLKQLINAPAQTAEEVEARCYQYCVVRFYRQIYKEFLDYVTQLFECMTEASSQLTNLRMVLRKFAMSFVPSGTVPASQPELMVESLDHGILSDNTFSLADFFTAELKENDAREILIREAENYLMANTGRNPGEKNRPQSGFPQSARPRLFNTGGGQRVIAAIPETASQENWSSKLASVFGDCVVAIQGDDPTTLAVTCEIENISIETLLDNFRFKNPRLMDVAARVHTRVDIDW